MKNNTFVKCDNDAAMKAVLRNEEDLGRKWQSGAKPTEETLITRYGLFPFYLRLDEQFLYYSPKRSRDGAENDDTVLTLEEYFAADRKTVKMAGYDVEDVTDQGFSIGCLDVTWEEVERVMALRPRKEGPDNE